MKPNTSDVGVCPLCKNTGNEVDIILPSRGTRNSNLGRVYSLKGESVLLPSLTRGPCVTLESSSHSITLPDSWGCFQ